VVSFRSLVVLAALAMTGWSTPVAGPSASGDPEVIFTFDDGPHPTRTAKILDQLAAHGIQAIFFMTADHFRNEQATGARELMARILREGHIVANHTVTHQDLCRIKAEAAAWEIDEAQATLEREAGMRVRWFRAPYGAFCPRLVGMVEERALTHFYWDIDPQEWKTRSAKKTEKRVIGALKRLRGRAVLLVHDIHAATVFALPKILAWIEAENARRAKAGERPIRIVDAPDYARELIGDERIAEARALADELTRQLAAGLASALP
jgi:peptidoglycan/xylan/chitin deacetylase (PgdA/CDA1 family)